MELAAWTTAVGTIGLAFATFVYVKQTAAATGAAQRAAQAAEASAQHSARAIVVAERAMLAQSMPMLITRWSASMLEGDVASISYTVMNVGKSTALNGLLRYESQEHKLPPIRAGMAERVRALPGLVVEGVPQPRGPVTLEYEDPIGNQLQTVCSPSARLDDPMFITSLRLVGGWEPLRVM